MSCAEADDAEICRSDFRLGSRIDDVEAERGHPSLGAACARFNRLPNCTLSDRDRFMEDFLEDDDVSMLLEEDDLCIWVVDSSSMVLVITASFLMSSGSIEQLSTRLLAEASS